MMDFLHLAAMAGPDFGHGAGDMAKAETGLALVLLALVFGMLGMTGGFILMARREQRKLALPEETEELLEDMKEDSSERKPASPFRRIKEKIRSDEDLAEPWEREANWWQKEEKS